MMQVRQIAAMRGLVANPKGEIIPRPIKANFREGLSVVEYFISTHGARKGLADTALRTADSGYLTRRLVDVSQDVIIREDDCGTERGLPKRIGQRLDDGRLVAADNVDTSAYARSAATEIVHPTHWRGAGRGRRRHGRPQDPRAGRRRHRHGPGPLRAHLRRQDRHLRQVLRASLATGKLVDIGEAVGIIAAQSIGEPGTQLTMRTFHTGGVAGDDITHGLPRVVELFEARTPKGKAPITRVPVASRMDETGTLGDRGLALAGGCASNSSTTRGRPWVMSSPATPPPVWKVRVVSCVPGSPIDWAAMMPTACRRRRACRWPASARRCSAGAGLERRR